VQQRFGRFLHNTHRSAAYITVSVFIIHFMAIKTCDLMRTGSWFRCAAATAAVSSRRSTYLRYPGVGAKLQAIQVGSCDANLLLRLILYPTVC